MIEVVASMARGPVFLAGELMECLITFTNPMSHLSTSASRYDISILSVCNHVYTVYEGDIYLLPSYFVHLMSCSR